MLVQPSRGYEQAAISRARRAVVRRRPTRILLAVQQMPAGWSCEAAEWVATDGKLTLLLIQNEMRKRCHPREQLSLGSSDAWV